MRAGALSHSPERCRRFAGLGYKNVPQRIGVIVQAFAHGARPESWPSPRGHLTDPFPDVMPDSAGEPRRRHRQGVAGPTPFRVHMPVDVRSVALSISPAPPSSPVQFGTSYPVVVSVLLFTVDRLDASARWRLHGRSRGPLAHRAHGVGAASTARRTTDGALSIRLPEASEAASESACLRHEPSALYSFSDRAGVDRAAAEAFVPVSVAEGCDSRHYRGIRAAGLRISGRRMGALAITHRR